LHPIDASGRQDANSFGRCLSSRWRSDPDIQQVESKFLNATLVDAAGTVGKGQLLFTIIPKI
jgi:hypothetical protein